MSVACRTPDFPLWLTDYSLLALLMAIYRCPFVLSTCAQIMPGGTG